MITVKCLIQNEEVLAPDLALLLLELFLHLNHFWLALDHRVSQSLILLVDRFELRLVVTDLTLHVADLALQVPCMSLGGPTPTCITEIKILDYRSFPFRQKTSLTVTVRNKAQMLKRKLRMAEFHLATSVSGSWYCACYLTVTAHWSIWIEQCVC